MSDIKDAAIGLSHISDGLFIGFGVRLDWNPSVPLQASDINIDVVQSHQFAQFAYFAQHTSTGPPIPTTTLHTPATSQRTSSGPPIATTIPTTTSRTPTASQYTPSAPQSRLCTPHYADVRTLVPQLSHIIDSSDTDSEVSDIESEDDEDRRPHTSWIITPPGSPPTSQAEADLPSPYYHEPVIAAFNFSRATQDYLLHIGASPCMLCRIDTSLDYSISEWLTCFEAAGLTHDQACALCARILSDLPSDNVEMLLAIAGI
ncbi:hypothetical protein DFH29DRAFT_879455 [Suillus ampliporus]|nr:hypothetical protein DFH29DRAFT_879455 [Suillus ampliporus]